MPGKHAGPWDSGRFTCAEPARTARPCTSPKAAPEGPNTISFPSSANLSWCKDFPLYRCTSIHFSPFARASHQSGRRSRRNTFASCLGMACRVDLLGNLVGSCSLAVGSANASGKERPRRSGTKAASPSTVPRSNGRPKSWSTCRRRSSSSGNAVFPCFLVLPQV